MDAFVKDLQIHSKNLDQNGFLVIENILSEEELKNYNDIYEDFISGNLDATNHRHDLGSHAAKDEKKAKNGENITQIMWPSLYLDETSVKSIEQSPIHKKAEKMAKSLLGDDMVFDFDMLISKVLWNTFLYLRYLNALILHDVCCAL